MKQLEPIIERGDFRYEQVWREGLWAIYRQTPKDGDWERFEVVHIRRHGARKFRNVTIEAGESYPTSEQWGTYEWTAITFHRAREIVREQASSPASRKTTRRLES